MRQQCPEMLSPDVFIRRKPWAMKVEFKQFLHREDISLQKAAEEIRSLFASRIGRIQEETMTSLHEIKTAYPDDLEPYLNDLVEAGADDDVEGFDDALSNVYDFCDEHRIWCGI